MYILRNHRLLFPKDIVFFSLKINLVLANSAEPDKMLHYVVISSVILLFG